MPWADSTKNLKWAEVAGGNGIEVKGIFKIRRPFCCFFYPFHQFDAFRLIICVRDGPEEQRKTKFIPKPPQVAAAHPHVLSIFHPDPHPFSSPVFILSKAAT